MYLLKSSHKTTCKVWKMCKHVNRLISSKQNVVDVEDVRRQIVNDIELFQHFIIVPITKNFKQSVLFLVSQLARVAHPIAHWRSSMMKAFVVFLKQ